VMFVNQFFVLMNYKLFIVTLLAVYCDINISCLLLHCLVNFILFFVVLVY